MIEQDPEKSHSSDPQLKPKPRQEGNGFAPSHSLDTPRPIQNRLKRRSSFEKWKSDLYAQFESQSDSSKPYRPPYAETDREPPTYYAYEPVLRTEHPDFAEDATKFAIRASQPPQPSAAEEWIKDEKEKVEGEQTQYLGSIQYGNQLNRGLDELRRFQEDRIVEVGQQSGLTPKQIERRRKLNSWGREENDAFEVG